SEEMCCYNVIIRRIYVRVSGDNTNKGKVNTDIKDREIAKRISILKQKNTTHVKITVKELNSFGRFHHSQGRLKKGDWEKVNQAIDYMELDPIKDKYLDELSGGQRQRAYIAMVLAQDTDYILLDEPLNNLDM